MKKLKRRGKSRQSRLTAFALAGRLHPKWRYRLAAVPKVHCLFCDRKIGRRRYVEITTLAQIRTNAVRPRFLRRQGGKVIAKRWNFCLTFEAKRNEMKTAGLAKLIQDLIADLLREFILHPAELKVVVIPLIQSIALRIEAHSGDVGRIIGEKGAHFRSLQAICMCASLKHGFEINLEWLPEPQGWPDRYQKFKARHDWGQAKILSLIKRTTKLIFRAEDAICVKMVDHNAATTVITIQVARKETRQVLELAGFALRTLFNAVGKANGRTLFVEVVASNSSDPPQPKSAAGRFSRELRR